MRTLLLWPFRPPALFVLLPFPPIAWVLLTLNQAAGTEPALQAMLVGFQLGVWYTLFGALALTAQRRLLHHSRGLNDEAVDRDTDLNPFREPTALTLTLLMLLPVAAVLAPPSSLAITAVAIGALLFPALWIAAALPGTPLDSWHPQALWALIRTTGRDWLWLTALISGSCGFLAFAVIRQLDVALLALATYAFLCCNGMAGALLHRHRLSLNLPVVRSPELERDANNAARDKALAHLFQELHRMCAIGRLRQANALLQQHIGNRADELHEIVHLRLRDFHFQDLMREHALDYLEYLIEHKRLQRAWELFKYCLSGETLFRPLRDESLLALCGIAGPEDGALVERLLRDFGAEYPDSSLIANAHFRLARLLAGWNRLAEARQIVAEVRTHYAEFAATPQFRELAAALEGQPDPAAAKSPRRAG